MHKSRIERREAGRLLPDKTSERTGFARYKTETVISREIITTKRYLLERPFELTGVKDIFEKQKRKKEKKKKRWLKIKRDEKEKKSD